MKLQKNIIVACTGSVATIKLTTLIEQLREFEATSKYEFNIKVITTEHAKHFFEIHTIPDDVPVLEDSDEWLAWQQRGDPVLHIELGKWADCLIIAPLSANTLAKMATGICDNLLLCMVRAWDLTKPLIFCPAMNTRMYEHPITLEQIDKLKSWGYHEVPSISKTLMCGDTGIGAMAEVETIVKITAEQLLNT